MGSIQMQSFGQWGCASIKVNLAKRFEGVMIAARGNLLGDHIVVNLRDLVIQLDLGLYIERHHLGGS